MIPLSLRKSDQSDATLHSGRDRKGFVLVEVIVAMVILAVAVSSLAGLVYSVSRSGIRTSGDAYRNGVLIQEVNRLEGIPYDSIATGTQSYTVSTGQYAHTRVITVAETQPNVIKAIKIVITPTNKSYKPDSISFIRTKSRTSRVLCTDCPQG